jgi:hypothetical protein
MFTPRDLHRGMTKAGYRFNQGRKIAVYTGGQIGRMIDWVKRAWWEVVGSDEIDHLKAGTSLEVVESMNGVISYAAKYLGKEGCFKTADGEPANVGRYWGVWAEELMPYAKAKTVRVLPEHWVKIRRTLRKYLSRQRGKKIDPRWGLASVRAFVGFEAIKGLIVLYAGRDAFECNGRMMALALSAIQRRDVINSAPPTATEEALMQSAELPPDFWSNDHE